MMPTSPSPYLLAGVILFPAASTNAQVSPQRTTATYQDWMVSCVMASTPGGQKACEVVQSQTLEGQTSPVSQITINRADGGGPFKLFVQVPANVWLQAGVKLATDDKDPGLGTVFKWCIPTRCLSDADLPDAVIKKMRAQTEPGRLEFKDASQRDVVVPVSFKGFSDALDALSKP